MKLPPRSPNLNAYAECFSAASPQHQESCLEHLILFGENSLRKPCVNFWLIIFENRTIRSSESGCSHSTRCLHRGVAPSSVPKDWAEC